MSPCKLPLDQNKFERNVCIYMTSERPERNELNIAPGDLKHTFLASERKTKLSVPAVLQYKCVLHTRVIYLYFALL